MATLKVENKYLITTDLEPNEPYEFTPTGEELKEEIMYRNIPLWEFAEKTGVPHATLNEVLNGRQEVSVELALLAEAALGTSPELWIRGDRHDKLRVAKREKTLAKELASIRENCIAESIPLVHPYMLRKELAGKEELVLDY